MNFGLVLLAALGYSWGFGDCHGKQREGLLFTCLCGCRGDTVEHLDPENSTVSVSSVIFKARSNLAAWKESVMSQNEYPLFFFLNPFSPKHSDKIFCLSEREVVSFLLLIKYPSLRIVWIFSSSFQQRRLSKITNSMFWSLSVT